MKTKDEMCFEIKRLRRRVNHLECVLKTTDAWKELDTKCTGRGCKLARECEKGA